LLPKRERGTSSCGRKLEPSRQRLPAWWRHACRQGEAGAAASLAALTRRSINAAAATTAAATAAAAEILVLVLMVLVLLLLLWPGSKQAHAEVACV